MAIFITKFVIIFHSSVHCTFHGSFSAGNNLCYVAGHVSFEVSILTGHTWTCSTILKCAQRTLVFCSYNFDLAFRLNSHNFNILALLAFGMSLDSEREKEQGRTTDAPQRQMKPLHWERLKLHCKENQGCLGCFLSGPHEQTQKKNAIFFSYFKSM